MMMMMMMLMVKTIVNKMTPPCLFWRPKPLRQETTLWVEFGIMIFYQFLGLVFKIWVIQPLLHMILQHDDLIISLSCDTIAFVLSTVPLLSTPESLARTQESCSAAKYWLVLARTQHLRCAARDHGHCGRSTVLHKSNLCLLEPPDSFGTRRFYRPKQNGCLI